MKNTPSTINEKALLLIQAAVKLQEAGEDQKALDVLITAQREAPAHAPIYLLMGLAEIGLGRNEDAEKHLRRAVRLAPDQNDALRTLGLLLSQQGRVKESVPLLKRYIGREIGHMPVLPPYVPRYIDVPDEHAPAADEGLVSEFGDLTPMTQKPNPAFKEYSALISGPQSVIARYLPALQALSLDSLDLGRPYDARKLLQQTWERTHSAATGVVLAKHLLAMGLEAPAQDVAYSVAYSCPGDDPESLVEAARVIMEVGMALDAWSPLADALAIDPTFLPALRLRAEVALAEGWFEGALESVKQALGVDPFDAQTLLAMASALYGLARYEEVWEAINTARAHLPGDARLASSLRRRLDLLESQTLWEVGRRDEALAKIDTLRRQFPQVARFACFESAILNDMDRSNEALQILDQALQTLDDRPLFLDNTLQILDETQAVVPDAAALVLAHYETLHRLGRIDEAWVFMTPIIESNEQYWLRKLRAIAMGLYRSRRVTEAKNVLRQLQRSAPKHAEFIGDLGFIATGEGNLAEAEQLLREALGNLRDGGRTSDFCSAALGYLCLLRGDYSQAGQILRTESLLGTQYPQEGMCRVASWKNGVVVPDPLEPPDEMPLSLAVRANLVTLALAEGRTADGESRAQQMIADTPDSAVGHKMLVWLEQALGQTLDVQRAWQVARERARQQEEENLASILRLRRARS